MFQASYCFVISSFVLPFNKAIKAVSKNMTVAPWNRVAVAVGGRWRYIDDILKMFSTSLLSASYALFGTFPLRDHVSFFMIYSGVCFFLLLHNCCSNA